MHSSTIDSQMYVASKHSSHDRVFGPQSSLGRFAARARGGIESRIPRLQRPADANMRSAAWVPGPHLDAFSDPATDVVNLHWINGGMVSIQQLGRIGRPVVWTMHDMWPFCGAEHYAPTERDRRWRTGYQQDNRYPDDRGIDLDRQVWERKVRAWVRPLHLVAPSRWLADCARDSALLSDWPSTVIPNPLPLDTFLPTPKTLARQTLGLPTDVPLILFGAAGGTVDPRKGWRLLEEAVRRTASARPDIECVILGGSKSATASRSRVNTHWLGEINDDRKMALAYSAADVTVVPSLQDNLPQGGTEAQASGCPVVAFDVGGLPDVVEHGTTGYLADPYDVADLAHGIKWVLAEPSRIEGLSAAARSRAVRRWGPDVVVRQYLDAYQTAIFEQTDPAKP